MVDVIVKVGYLVQAGGGSYDDTALLQAIAHLAARVEALEGGAVVIPEISVIAASTNITASTIIQGAA